MGNSKNIVYVLLAFVLLVNGYELSMYADFANTMELCIKLACMAAILYLGYLNSKR